jgi:hypothetical protein
MAIQVAPAERLPSMRPIQRFVRRVALAVMESWCRKAEQFAEEYLHARYGLSRPNQRAVRLSRRFGEVEGEEALATSHMRDLPQRRMRFRQPTL